MKTHIFDIDVAKQYGVDIAVIIEHLKFWLAKNLANNKNIYDGKAWTYNSIKAWSDLFPYWSPDQIRRLLKKAERLGAIETGNFNKSAYDRTKWYTIKDIALYSSIGRNRQMKDAKSPNERCEIASPIPDINTDINTDINPPISPQGGEREKSKSINSKKNNYSDEFLKFWDEYDFGVGKDVAAKEFNKQSAHDCLDEIIRNISERKRLGHYSNGEKRYRPKPTTYLRKRMWKDEIVDKRSQEEIEEDEQERFRQKLDREIDELAASGEGKDYLITVE